MLKDLQDTSPGTGAGPHDEDRTATIRDPPRTGTDAVDALSQLVEASQKTDDEGAGFPGCDAPASR